MQALGLTKGSGLLRLFFRASNKSLKQVGRTDGGKTSPIVLILMPQIEEEEKVLEEETKAREQEQELVKKQIAEKEQIEREKRAQAEREKQQATSVYVTVNVLTYCITLTVE